MVFSDHSLQFDKKKKFMVKFFDIGRIFGKSGAREVVAQIGSLSIKLRGLKCLLSLKLLCHTYVYITGQDELW